MIPIPSRRSPTCTRTTIKSPAFPHPLQSSPHDTCTDIGIAIPRIKTPHSPPLITTGRRYPVAIPIEHTQHIPYQPHHQQPQQYHHHQQQQQQHQQTSHAQAQRSRGSRFTGFFRRKHQTSTSSLSTTSTSATSSPTSESDPTEWILPDNDTPISSSAPVTPTYLDHTTPPSQTITSRPSRIHQWKHRLHRAKGLIHTMITSTSSSESDHMNSDSLAQSFSLSSLTSSLTCTHTFTNAPTWLLGYCYKYLAEGPSHRPHAEDERQRRIESFLQDYTSRIWMTYRKGFPEIGHSGYGTDAGWGCMLRSAQMILIQAYIMHYMGRSWRWNMNSCTQILNWFLDTPSSSSPYSIHNMLEYGETSGGSNNTNGKKVGEWFGPFTACAMLDKCVRRHGLSSPVLIMSEDGSLYYDQIMSKCSIKQEHDSKHDTNDTPHDSTISQQDIQQDIQHQVPIIHHDPTIQHDSQDQNIQDAIECESIPTNPTTTTTTTATTTRSRSSSTSSSDTDEVLVTVPHVHTMSSSSDISQASASPLHDITPHDIPSQPSDTTSHASSDSSTLDKATAMATTATQHITSTFTSFLSYASQAITGTTTPTATPSEPETQSMSDSTDLSSSHVTVNHTDIPTTPTPTSPSSPPHRDSMNMSPSNVDMDPTWRACIILIPVRLGMGDRMNPEYIPNLLSCFQFPQSLGLIGGKPRTAYYFIGVQEQKLFYLDPHTVQKTVSEENDWSSYHCSTIQSVPVTSIDPSLAIGFYCRTRADFEAFWEQAKTLSSTKYPVFSVSDKSPSYLFDDMNSESDEEDVDEEEIKQPTANTSRPIMIPARSPNSLSSSVSEGTLVDADDSLSLTGSPVLVSASSSPAFPPPNFTLEQSSSEHRTPPPHHMPHDTRTPTQHSQPTTPHTKRQGSKRKSKPPVITDGDDDGDEFVLL